jgi:uncharacterized protein YbbC (DUF1343 family)
MTSVYLYPTIGLFEGTNVSAGRGTDFPFQTFGSPTIASTEFSYTPVSKPGAKYPKYKNQKCYGKDLRNFDWASFYKDPEIQLNFLFWAYQNTSNKDEFFLKNHFYGRLAGTTMLQTQIEEKTTILKVRKSWSDDLELYKVLRKKYLLYKDF